MRRDQDGERKGLVTLTFNVNIVIIYPVTVSAVTVFILAYPKVKGEEVVREAQREV